MTNEERIMSELIEYGHVKLVERKAYPFCAAIVKDDVIVSRGHGTYDQFKDKTTHGEMVAIRKACKGLSVGIDLKGYSLYSTCEPCLACFDTALWAGIRHFVFAVDHRDFPDYFHDHPYQIEDYQKDNPGEIKVVDSVLKKEAIMLFKTAKQIYGW